jgi:hypothetical protein
MKTRLNKRARTTIVALLFTLGGYPDLVKKSLM